MKILVTGCAGFIGSSFALYLIKNYPSDLIVGVDCLTYAANEEALDKLLSYDRFRLYKENICDRAIIDGIFAAEKPDIVVNFAAETHVDNSILDSYSFVETNVVGTQVLLDASVRYGVSRFHQISTDEVYGDLPVNSANRFYEDSPLNPSSPYSASKAAADLLALSYTRTHGLSVSISRSTNNYGIYQHSEKLIPTVIRSLVKDQPVPVYGSGENVRDWLYVADHCRAIDIILRKGTAEIYNVGADNYYSNVDLIKKIMTLSGYPDGEIKFVADRKGHDRRYTVNFDKLRALGWQPQADFAVELKNTIEWYKGKYK